MAEVNNQGPGESDSSEKNTSRGGMEGRELDEETMTLVRKEYLKRLTAELSLCGAQ